MKNSLIITLFTLYAFCTSLDAMNKIAPEESISTAISSESKQPRSPFQRACYEGDTKAIEATLPAILQSEEPEIELRIAFNNTLHLETVKILYERAADQIGEDNIGNKFLNTLDAGDTAIPRYLLTRINLTYLRTALRLAEKRKASLWITVLKNEFTRRRAPIKEPKTEPRCV